MKNKKWIMKQGELRLTAAFLKQLFSANLLNIFLNFPSSIYVSSVLDSQSSLVPQWPQKCAPMGTLVPQPRQFLKQGYYGIVQLPSYPHQTITFI